MSPTRVAIVGSGISGLSAFWELRQDSQNLFDVHLFEANDYFGGHTRSVHCGDTECSVDVGFCLFNKITYPTFTTFLKALGVETSPARITFGFSRHKDQFEWSSRSLWTVFPQWRDILSFERWAMIWGILKFNICAEEVLHPQYRVESQTVGDYLDRNHYPKSFRDNYLFPLLSSIWIHDPEQPVASMPMTIVVQYLRNHQLLHMFSHSVDWLTVKGGAQTYVDQVLRKAPQGRLHKGTEVKSILPSQKGLTLVASDPKKHFGPFEHVILATSAPNARDILREHGRSDQTTVLDNFKTTDPSTVVLHSDESFMPQDRALWSAWNYHERSGTDLAFHSSRVSLTADMGQILQLQTNERILATLNPEPSAFPSSKMKYCFQHPVYNDHTVGAQRKLSRIQGQMNVWFAGAWMGSGFHEDGCTAGLKAASMIRRQMCHSTKPSIEIQDWKDNEGPSCNHWTRAIRYFLRGLETFVRYFLAIHWPWGNTNENVPNHTACPRNAMACETSR